MCIRDSCRDIAVVARNLPAYEGLLDVALEEAGIPSLSLIHI